MDALRIIEALHLEPHPEGGMYAETWRADGRSVETARLGPDLGAGERPQLVVAPHAWQTARSLGAWTLVGCTVSHGFEFDRFELAPPAWEPPDA